MKGQRIAENVGALIMLLLLAFAISYCTEGHSQIPTHIPGRYVLILKSWTSGGDAYAQFTTLADFKDWDRCKSAGLEVKARLETDLLHIDFVCVARG